ncbi:ABC transporter substrate-binding protein [Bosea sp. BIWAKO-01]|uniref:ABC transporter substrate-binding protein n=1 Tax=Bosea sp. BIWAKO-01 TaxID=506668 RepID=UPI001FCCC6B8|nr:ABC transporter substrate-binding protein [Bosea sp. BIWAKO-01]
MTYTFRLRHGVKFHNGADLTSADVLWNWQRYMTPSTDWRCIGEFDGRSGLQVVSAEAPDPSSFIMRINRPSALFLDALARTDCGMTGIVHRSSLMADGSWDKPIGTGPYEFSDWKRGRGVTLTRFKDYKSPAGAADGYVGQKDPQIDIVQLDVIPDPATVKLAIASRSIDVAQIMSSDMQELRSNSGIVTLASPDSSKHAILFRTEDPVIGDQKFRQAIAAALDYKQLVEATSDGLSTPNDSAVFSGSVYFGAVQKKGVEFNLERARKLLGESTYRGQTIKLIANKRSPMPSFQVALVTQDMLKAIGVNVDIEVLEWATQLDRYNSGKYQMMSFSYSARLDPALSYEQFSGDKAKQPRKVWDNPKALELLQQSYYTTDPAIRRQLFDGLHEMMSTDVPLVLLYNGLTVWAHGKNVTGFAPWEGKMRLWSVKIGQ